MRLKEFAVRSHGKCGRALPLRDSGRHPGRHPGTPRHCCMMAKKCKVCLSNTEKRHHIPLLPHAQPAKQASLLTLGEELLVLQGHVTSLLHLVIALPLMALTHVLVCLDKSRADADILHSPLINVQLPSPRRQLCMAVPPNLTGSILC